MSSIFETINHNRAFPAKVFITQINRCAFHWHHDYEIIMILKGSVTVYCGEEPFVLSAGDIFLFNNKVTHGISRTGSENLVLCIQFSPEIIAPKADYQQFDHYFFLNSTSDMYIPQKTYRYFQSRLSILALQSQRNTASSALRTYSMVLALVSDLLDYVQFDLRRPPVVRPDEPQMDDMYNKILQYIDQNLQAENLTRLLCKNLGMSEKSLYRYLKKTLGITMKDLLNIIRTEKACAMLKTTKKAIPIIWQTCGFSSEVAFYRNFKAQMGMTPSEYRQGADDIANPFDGESYAGFNLGEANRILFGYSETNL